MLVTFTNASAAAVYVSCLSCSIAAGGSVQVRRTAEQLRAEQALKALVVAGTITLAFTEETGDDAALGHGVRNLSYSNATRPAAADVPLYSMIWNTDDNAPNWSDGTNWRDSAGITT